MMKERKMGRRSGGEFVRALITLRKEHKEWIKRNGINLSGFVQDRIDEEMYLPLVIVKVAGADNPEIPIMSVVLLPKEKEGELQKGRRGTYLLLDGEKYYVKPIGWDAVRKRKSVYVWR